MPQSNRSIFRAPHGTSASGSAGRSGGGATSGTLKQLLMFLLGVLFCWSVSSRNKLDSIMSSTRMDGISTSTGSGSSQQRQQQQTSPDSPRVYPLDEDEIEKYHVDVKTGVHWVGDGNRWKKVTNPTFYDCPPAVMTKYKPASSVAAASPHFKGQEGEDKYILQHFFTAAKTRPHFFIELGALDGVMFSNSFYFDKQLGWGGLLIEGETLNYVKLETNRRQNKPDQTIHVTTAHVAICTQQQFIQMSGTGPEAAAGNAGSPGGTRVTIVPCVPMRQVVQMAKLPYVDFYSIDVEGAELAVITSHDYVAVPVHTLLIEMRPADEDKDYSNAKVRRALHARGMCRYDNIVGHNNEVWVNRTWVEPQ